MISFVLLLVAAGLVLLNAFFVAAEFSMVKLRHTRVEEIKEKYGIRSKILGEIHQHLDAYLSACQLGITFASLGLGWIGEPAVAELLEPVFLAIGLNSPEAADFIAFFIAFAFLSFLHIVVGELMPKSLAIRQSERVSVWTAIPLYLFYWVMYPAIWLLNNCSNYLLKATKLDEIHNGEQAYSTDEIRLILNSSHLHGELTKEEAEILEHTIDFSELNVTEVMRPIEEMAALEEAQDIEQSFKVILEKHYSRYPIYKESLQDIVGIIHVKDLLPLLYEKKEIKSLDCLIRPILKVTKDLSAIELLRQFREGMPHFAIVYNGMEAPLGFVTLDNLLHFLIGKIKDEFHKTEDEWVELPDHSFLVHGNCAIYTIERALDVEVLVNPKIHTISGLILEQLGSLPKVGEVIEFDTFTACICKMKGHRILQVKIQPKFMNK